MARDLYRIDDVLLRAGAWSALVLGIVFALVLAAGSDAAAAPASGLGGHAGWLALAGLCPVALLSAGFAMRRRERRIGALWDLLRQGGEISVPALLANSDFQRSDLLRAVRFLNNRGLGHYVWTPEADVIQDARLLEAKLHVDKCEACGASVLLDLPVGLREIPRCPHCHEPVCVDDLQERRDALLAELRAEAREETRRARVTASGSFSPVLFVLLLVTCWPAALVYAWWKGRDRL